MKSVVSRYLFLQRKYRRFEIKEKKEKRERERRGEKGADDDDHGPGSSTGQSSRYMG